MQATRLSLQTWPKWLAGDKGYSYPRIRQWLHHHQIGAVIPRRVDQIARDGRVAFDRDIYRRRNVVERCIGWLKEFRRIATRFDKLAISFLAMVKLAMILCYLRALAV